MDSSSTPTTEASPHVYPPRLSLDDISITASTSDEFFDADSFIYNPSLNSSQTSIASYKTEKSINSRKSGYNALPRHKYAGLEHLRPLQGHVLSDVEDASNLEVCRTIRCWDNHNYTSVIFQTDLRDESDEATRMIKTAESDMATTAHHSGRSTSITPEHKTIIDDILKTAGQSVHRSEAESFLFT